jgi:excinuclease ABC subunit C
MTEETILAEDGSGALKAADLIRDEARRAPDKPGVYRMYGEDGTCLYVGKARRSRSAYSSMRRGGSTPSASG